jgi:hypothetical protein
MNMNNNQTQSNEQVISIDYCRTSYNVEGLEVINNYRCGQRSFSTSDLWRIRRSNRSFAINSGISTN